MLRGKFVQLSYYTVNFVTCEGALLVEDEGNLKQCVWELFLRISNAAPSAVDHTSSRRRRLVLAKELLFM
jgi:hypothetical protein